VEGEDPLDCVERFNATLRRGGMERRLAAGPADARGCRANGGGVRLAPDAVVVKGLYPAWGWPRPEDRHQRGHGRLPSRATCPCSSPWCAAYEGLGVAGKIQAMSTGPNAPVVLLSGPVISQLGSTRPPGLAGPGSPSHVNTVVGRALRLILMNIGRELTPA